MPARSGPRPEEDAWRALDVRRPGREYGFVGPGDELWLTSIANTLTVGTFTAVPIGWIEVMPLWGGTPVFRRIANTNATAGRTPDSDGPVRLDTTGWIVDGGVTFDNVTASAFKRGMLYSSLRIRRPASDRGWTTLAAGYLTGDRPNVPIGRIEDSGPSGGEGLLSWVAPFAADRAGNAVAVDLSLAATNALRKVYGLVWYYDASADVATRTFNSPSLVNVGPAKPTGWTTTGGTGFFWDLSANITLTASEEGAFVSLGAEGKDGRTVTNDNGAATIVASSTSPTPWPLLVTEDDLAVLRFPAITTGNANDRHSAYVLIEEWLKL